MNGKRTWTGAALVLALMVAGGCGFLKREEGKNRVILKAGWQVGADQADWVGVPGLAPKEAKDANKGIAYAVLSTHNVVPDKMDGWQAYSPKAFEKLSGIQVPPQKTPEGELWPMKEGRRVPKEKDGWVGVAPMYPRIVDGTGAVLAPDLIVPKEMDGWACVDRETSAKLWAAFEMQGQIPEKKK